ncbi:SMI1/KNR4 family protein [Phenylobacterium sp.]|uniref:SMI1/KNR4 family protein n=1 Tax=Phenylobacterium sp. TaxID=1871053 RepID=UPI0035B4A5DE
MSEGATAISYRLTEGQLDPPGDSDVIAGLTSGLGVALPPSYLSFLRQHNGGEGFVGDSYVVLWRAEDLVDFNREYEVAKYAPGIILFGSNGGGEGYGFDTQLAGLPIVQLPFIGMERRYATPIAEDFIHLFAKLADTQ